MSLFLILVLVIEDIDLTALLHYTFKCVNIKLIIVLMPFFFICFSFDYEDHGYVETNLSKVTAQIDTS